MNELDKTDGYSDQEIEEIYKLKNIAVVGMSPTEGKPSNYVPKFLIEKGYNVTPINPNYPFILNRKTYGNVSEVQESIDIVDIFRKPDDVLPVIKDSLNKEGVKVIWMQKGIYNKEAERLALEKGIKVVYNRCMLEEFKRLLE
ncbi:MAG TPA: CoA-binding protein [Candidatus Nitrosocosmicus sp.]|nr:CoA-binding protein [Candidatus Nitrosocosmicus sp.]